MTIATCAVPNDNTHSKSTPDPIFAAIERYRVADAAYDARCRLEDAMRARGMELIPAPGDSRTPEMVAAVEAVLAARQNLARVIPTTAAGFIDFLYYIHVNEMPIDLDNGAVVTDSFFDGEYERWLHSRQIYAAARRLLFKVAHKGSWTDDRQDGDAIEPE
jgi:hypothetical protein